ncbi:hypothetical protein N9850_04150 [Granulosicoccus sp.]|nr:hypothetical protein [Granulosicoccus sp.]MDB4222941.1 hypothetical protein [Granulosicoccus sp.]
MLQSFAIVLYALFVAFSSGCAQPAKATLQSKNLEYQFSTINGELWARDSSGDSYLFPIKGQDFNPLPSPDRRWLAVEVQKMSNLRVLKLFRQSDEGFTETHTNASTYLWNKARREDGLDTDNVSQPSITVLGWREAESVLTVELRALAFDGAPYQRTFDLSINVLEP